MEQCKLCSLPLGSGVPGLLLMRVSCAGDLGLGWSLVIMPPKKPELACTAEERSYFEKVSLGSFQFENKSVKKEMGEVIPSGDHALSSTSAQFCC